MEARAGTFKRPLFAADGITCTGVETADGTSYHADKVILAAGAWSSTLVDLDDQCVSKVSEKRMANSPLFVSFLSPLAYPATNTNQIQAWVYAHIQLTPEEVSEFKNIPVVYDGEYGFFFEPNEYAVILHPGISRKKSEC